MRLFVATHRPGSVIGASQALRLRVVHWVPSLPTEPTMRIFVPIEDAGIEHATDVLVPYRQGLACAHQLRGTLSLRDGVWCERSRISDESSARRPTSDPASSPDRH